MTVLFYYHWLYLYSVQWLYYFITIDCIDIVSSDCYFITIDCIDIVSNDCVILLPLTVLI